MAARPCGFESHPRHMEFIYGELERAPAGFVPVDQWPEYAYITQPAPVCAREEVGTHPRGIRWTLWPFTFEDYVSDEEPSMADSRRGRYARSRVVTWERVRRQDVPRGWRQFSARPFRVDGVKMFKEGEDFAREWEPSAQRKLRTFKKEVAAGRYAIEPVHLEEFSAAYRQSLIGQKIENRRLADLEKKLAYPAFRDNIEYWGVRNTATGAVVAGTAIVYSPTYRGSSHFAPFILPEAREMHAATGLVEHWFAQTIARGYAFATTTNFWFKGEPEEWKGFSEFKSHFGFAYVHYPPVLYKFVLGKIF